MTNQFLPDYAVLPGEHIVEFLEVRGLSQLDLATMANVPPTLVTDVISGAAQITPEFAQHLGDIVGPSAQFWVNLEANYQATIKRLNMTK